MKLNTYLVVSLSVVVFLLSAFSELGISTEDRFIRMKGLGGVRDCNRMQNSAEIESVGRFAVEEHNKKENALIEFSRVVKAKEQVVSGKIYHLTLEAVEAGKKKVYEAKVWVKPWMNFKQLQEFKYTHDASSLTSADLGVKRGRRIPRWETLPTYDQVVQDAAHHAVNTIQQRSNSLSPYQLLEILVAKLEAIEGSTKIALLLKVKRGSIEEKFNVVVHRNLEGKFYLNQMEQDRF